MALFGADFWVDENGAPLVVPEKNRENSIEVIEGFRFVWTRNEYGQLYRKSLGQIGYHLAKTCTLQEYAAQAREMAIKQIEGMDPNVKAALGLSIHQALMDEQFALMAVAPQPLDSGGSSGAVFL